MAWRQTAGAGGGMGISGHKQSYTCVRSLRPGPSLSSPAESSLWSRKGTLQGNWYEEREQQTKEPQAPFDTDSVSHIDYGRLQVGRWG